MISSRQQMAVEIVAVPDLMSSSALPCQTSVPWERPEIRIRSENSFGFASRRSPMAKSVPNSGIPRVPMSQFQSSSGVTPRASVFMKRLMTFLSSRGIFVASRPVRSSSIRIMVGSSWPRMSSFRRLLSIL